MGQGLARSNPWLQSTLDGRGWGHRPYHPRHFLVEYITMMVPLRRRGLYRCRRQRCPLPHQHYEVVVVVLMLLGLRALVFDFIWFVHNRLTRQKCRFHAYQIRALAELSLPDD